MNKKDINISKLLEENKIKTTRELAKEYGVSAATISKWIYEAGQTPVKHKTTKKVEELEKKVEELENKLEKVRQIAHGVRAYLQIPHLRDVRYEMDRILEIIRG